MKHRHLDLGFQLVVAAIMIVMTIEPSYALGDTMYAAMTNVMFGPWGMVIGIVILFGAIFTFFRFGMGATLLVIAVAFFFFLIPAIIHQFSLYGRSVQNN